MKIPMFATLGGVLGVGLAMFALDSFHAAALDPTGGLPAVIPYGGQLERDGAGHDGDVDMRFTLYDQAGDQVWQEEWTDATSQVTVYGGRFSVLLGTHANDSVIDAVSDGDALDLGVEVRDGGSAWTTLSGLRRLAPTAYALWGARSTHLNVGGTLTANGTTDIGGDLRVQDGFRAYNSLGQLHVGSDSDGNESSGRLGVAFGDPDAGEGVQIVYATTAGAMVVEKGTDFADGDNLLRISGESSDDYRVMIDGAATLGAATFDGTLEVDNAEEITISSADASVVMSVGAVVYWEDFNGDVTQMHYSTYSNQLIVSHEGTILMRWDKDGDTWTQIPGTATVGGRLELEPMAMNSASSVESNAADKKWFDDSSCTTGAIVAALIDTGSGGGQAALCACFGASDEKGKGWYCLE